MRRLRRQRLRAKRLRTRAKIYVDAEKSKVPQAAARAKDWQSVARRSAGVWRIRFEGSRTCVDYRPADGGGAGGDCAFHQARRKFVDRVFPGQAVHEEAGR